MAASLFRSRSGGHYFAAGTGIGKTESHLPRAMGEDFRLRVNRRAAAVDLIGLGKLGGVSLLAAAFGFDAPLAILRWGHMSLPRSRIR